MLLDLLQIRRDERHAFFWAAAWFTTVLAAYYIVRPVREAMGSIEGSDQLKWLFTAVFLTMLVAVPLYGQLVGRFPRRKLVPVIYRFLMFNLIGFSAGMRWLDESSLRYLARVFFVWVSVYVLFSTSLFWSVMADIFSRESGKRLFGAIPGFGTVGAILASLFVSHTAESIGPANLLLVSAALMEAGLWCFRRLNQRQAVSLQTQSETDTVSRNPFNGFLHVVQSPYLRCIMLYVFCTTACGTYLYLTQADLMKQAYPDRDSRTGVFARIDLAVQIVTVVFQVLLASRLMKFSLSATLCVLPAIYAIGFAGLSVSPALVVLVAAMVLSRASTYGLAVPALGVLYTVVSHEDKYKAKSVIDTLVIRGGDAAWNWLVTAVRTAGVGPALTSTAMVPFAMIGIGLAALLGKRNAVIRSENPGEGIPASLPND